MLRQLAQAGCVETGIPDRAGQSREQAAGVQGSRERKAGRGERGAGCGEEGVAGLGVSRLRRALGVPFRGAAKTTAPVCTAGLSPHRQLQHSDTVGNPAF